jgi:hypothetical protein
MLILSRVRQTLSSRLRLKGAKPGHTDTATVPRQFPDNPVTFYNRTSQMPSTCSIRALNQDVTPSDIKGADLKTSFSR